MFVLCESMKWSHLPVQGGLYDQNPDLLDGFRIIFNARAHYEAEEARKRDAEADAERRKSGANRMRKNR